MGKIACASSTDLEERNIKSGSFLDLGTGSATQAFQLAKMGFRVTGSDISKAAINRANQILYNQCKTKNDPHRPNPSFIVDDILDSKIKDDEFDYVFDRGCFHILPDNMRHKYV